MATATNIHRQAAAPRRSGAASDPAQRVRRWPSSNPRNWPITIANCHSDPTRPRMLVGEISAIYAGTTALAAPMPRPVTNRESPNGSTALSTAVAKAMTYLLFVLATEGAAGPAPLCAAIGRGNFSAPHPGGGQATLADQSSLPDIPPVELVPRPMPAAQA